MLKVCVKLVHRLSTSELFMCARLYTIVIQSVAVFVEQVGKAVVIPSSSQNLSTQLYDAFYAKPPLLNKSFTPFPQTLLLTTKKV
jgi:hypothetical protein